MVERKRQDRSEQVINIRALVLKASARWSTGGEAAVFEFCGLAGSRRNLRPDELLMALDRIGGGWLEVAEARYHRKGLYTVKGDRFVPLV